MLLYYSNARAVEVGGSLCIIGKQIVERSSLSTGTDEDYGSLHLHSASFHSFCVVDPHSVAKTKVFVAENEPDKIEWIRKLREASVPKFDMPKMVAASSMSKTNVATPSKRRETIGASHIEGGGYNKSKEKRRRSSSFFSGGKDKESPKAAAATTEPAMVLHTHVEEPSLTTRPTSSTLEAAAQITQAHLEGAHAPSGMPSSSIDIDEDYFPQQHEEHASPASSSSSPVRAQDQTAAEGYTAPAHSYALEELCPETQTLVETFLPHMQTVLVPKAEVLGEKKTHSVVFTVVVLVEGNEKTKTSASPKGFALHRTIKEVTDLRVKLEKAESIVAPIYMHDANDTSHVKRKSGVDHSNIHHH